MLFIYKEDILAPDPSYIRHTPYMYWWERNHRFPAILGPMTQLWPIFSVLKHLKTFIVPWVLGVQRHGISFTKCIVDFYGKCRQIYHTWMLWVIEHPRKRSNKKASQIIPKIRIRRIRQFKLLRKDLFGLVNLIYTPCYMSIFVEFSPRSWLLWELWIATHLYMFFRYCCGDQTKNCNETTESWHCCEFL